MAKTEKGREVRGHGWQVGCGVEDESVGLGDEGGSEFVFDEPDNVSENYVGFVGPRPIGVSWRNDTNTHETPDRGGENTYVLSKGGFLFSILLRFYNGGPFIGSTST